MIYRRQNVVRDMIYLYSVFDQLRVDNDNRKNRRGRNEQCSLTYNYRVVANENDAFPLTVTKSRVKECVIITLRS